jgi:hypothetical protein
MSRYDTHQAAVGRGQGGTTLFVTAGGFFDVGDVAGGANGTQIDGRKLQLQMLSPAVKTSVVVLSATVGVSVISPAYGYIFITADSAWPSASLYLPTASAGAILFINAAGVQSDMQIVASGVSLVGIRNSNLSRLSFTNASVNSAWVQLNCFTDGEWSVVRYSNRTGVGESPA